MTLLLNVQGLAKRFGPRPLFTDLSLDLCAGERLGLIGPNGSGKSTLLKLLAGADEPDAGTRSLRRGTRVGYLAQNDQFPAGLTVHDALVAALANEPIEDYERETQAAITLTQVGFSDFEQKAEHLSGGQAAKTPRPRAGTGAQARPAVARRTNQSPRPARHPLARASLLRAAPFGYLVATHDRTFLRAVADEVIEVSRVYPGGSFRAPGSYDDFAEKREAFLEAQAKEQESVANQVRRETDWLGRKAAARTQRKRPARASTTPCNGAKNFRNCNIATRRPGPPASISSPPAAKHASCSTPRASRKPWATVAYYLKESTCC